MKKPKPRYNTVQNCAFMIGRAWRMNKNVLFVCLVIVLSSAALRIVQTLALPMILAKIETRAPLAAFLTTVGLVSVLILLLSVVKEYSESSVMYGRSLIRLGILSDLQTKLNVTSFPNTQDPKFIALMKDAFNTTNSNSAPTEVIWESMTKVLENVLGAVFYLLLLSNLNPVLVLLVTAAAVISYYSGRRIRQWEYEHREESEKLASQLNYIAERAEDIRLAKDVRIFGMRSWLHELYAKYRALRVAFTARREKRYLWIYIIDIALTFLKNAAAYWYLIRVTVENGLPASEFLLYFTALSGFTEWISQILASCGELHDHSLKLCIVREYLEFPEIFRFDGGIHVSPQDGRSPELELRNVSFRYPGAEKDTIRNLSLTIRPGEKVAVVGLNGAGKTTLVKLLCGFIDPTEGEVLMNGVNVKDYNRAGYYSLFTAVFQQFSVLACTAAENLSQKMEEFDEERVWDCLERAGLAEKFRNLPDGILTHIGREIYDDGITLSGGETQRLMLARALYKDAPVLILDEPTAALDPIAENDMYMKYNSMTEGRTSVFISHRLASTRFCDRILFMEDGGIAEQGTHEELLAAGGGYSRLFAVQSRYYQEGAESHEE